MHALSSIIVIILLLMITIALVSLAYMFFSVIMAQTTQAGTNAINTATTSLLAQMEIESVSINSVYVRNTGSSDLTNFSVYVNDVPANFNVTPSVIKSGQVGTVNIYDFIKSGDIISITTAQGISATTVAPDPCQQAVACYNFDEGIGTIAYDSSGNGNDGTLSNASTGYTCGVSGACPDWVTGKYGNALKFDGIGDYVNAGNGAGLNLTNSFTISLWINPSILPQYGSLVWKGTSTNPTYGLYIGGSSWGSSGSQVQYVWTNSSNYRLFSSSGYTISAGIWTNIIYTYNGTVFKLYINGIDTNINANQQSPLYPFDNLLFGKRLVSTYMPFNGTIDEVRIYNKAIY